VLLLAPQPLLLSGAVAGGHIHVGLLETLPDDIDRHITGVAHIAGIEAVVAQLVHHDLITIEVMAIRIILHQLVHSEQERAFAQLVAVGAISEVTDGADRENKG